MESACSLPMRVWISSGYTLAFTHIHTHINTRIHTQLHSWTADLICMSLGFERKPELPEETHSGLGREHVSSTHTMQPRYEEKPCNTSNSRQHSSMVPPSQPQRFLILSPRAARFRSRLLLACFERRCGSALPHANPPTVVTY